MNSETGLERKKLEDRALEQLLTGYQAADMEDVVRLVNIHPSLAHTITAISYPSTHLPTRTRARKLLSQDRRMDWPGRQGPNAQKSRPGATSVSFFHLNQLGQDTFSLKQSNASQDLIAFILRATTAIRFSRLYSAMRRSERGPYLRDTYNEIYAEERVTDTVEEAEQRWKEFKSDHRQWVTARKHLDTLYKQVRASTTLFDKLNTSFSLAQLFFSTQASSLSPRMTNFVPQTLALLVVL